MTYIDVCIFVSQRGPDSGLRPVAYERTRPVTDFSLWMLTGSDLTLGSYWEQRIRSVLGGVGARE